MNNSSKILKREYFKIDDGKVIYPASVSRRFMARLLDYLIAILVSEIMITIYISTGSFSHNVSDPFNTWIYAQYDPVMMSAWALRIFLIIGIAIVYPIFFNKKNPGQSPGKKMMGITPLFLEHKKDEKLIMLTREVPITFLFILPTIFTLILGYDVNYVHATYVNYVNNWNKVHAGGAVLVAPTGTYDFVINYWAASGANNTSGQLYTSLTDGQVVIACIQQSAIYLYFVAFLGLWISMLFDSQKRGAHDKFARTAVVDLKTITTLEQAEYRYNILIGNVTSVAGNFDNNPIELNPSEGVKEIEQEIDNSPQEPLDVKKEDSKVEEPKQEVTPTPTKEKAPPKKKKTATKKDE